MASNRQVKPTSYKKINTKFVAFTSIITDQTYRVKHLVQISNLSRLSLEEP